MLPKGVPVAPDSARVDLTVPRFSHPTEVTNPLFPVSRQASVLFVGHVDGQPFRTEVTLLPETRLVEWGGQEVETLVSQYTAFLGGRLQEVAYDLYAQADDGSVWYFGEDVADLEDGAIVRVAGKAEPLIEIAAERPDELARFAWHIGNRHIEMQVVGDRLRIRRDHVLEEMLRGLGARLTAIEAPFDPERGAYGRGHGENHGR